METTVRIKENGNSKKRKGKHQEALLNQDSFVTNAADGLC